jgi:hypothetical protein
MGILTDDQGRFHDPDCAASHAFFVEKLLVPVGVAARQMIERGGAEADRARAWLSRRGLAESELTTAAGLARVSVIAAGMHGC